jgi:hypothetical protein
MTVTGPPPRLPWSSRVLSLTLFLGISFRFLAFTTDRPLWIDEAMLVLNIAERTPLELLEPLDHNQAAPIGFLLLIKGATVLFGESERVLRLVPFVGSILGLLAFAVAALRWLPTPASQLAVAVFAVSPTIVSYAAEVKPYSTDAATSAVLLAISASLIRKSTVGRGRWWVMGLTGLVAIWLSYPAVFVLGGIGGVLTFQAFRTRQTRRPTVMMVMAWLISFSAQYGVNLKPSSANPYLTTYWDSHFLPFTPSVGVWLVEHLVNLFHTACGFGGDTFRAAGLAAVAAGVGVVTNWRESRCAEVGIVGITVLLTLLASALRTYPFEGRLLLFLVPLVVGMVAQGTVAISDHLCGWSRFGVLAVVFAAPLTETLHQWRHPPRMENLPGVLAKIQDLWQAGDRVYVYNGSGNLGAGPAFRWYNRSGAFPAEAVIEGGMHRADPSQYRVEVFALHPPGRVWVVFSHRHRDEETLICSHFDQIGERIRTISRIGAAGYEYQIRPKPPLGCPAPALGK